MKILLAGTFDLFHKGHEFFLSSALQKMKKGDSLHVIIARDKNVEKIKNKTPIHSEEMRKKNVEAFLEQCLEKTNIQNIFVYLGDENDFLALPKKIKPDCVWGGYDQIIPEKIRKHEIFSQCIFEKCEAYFPEKYKTSLMKY